MQHCIDSDSRAEAVRTSCATHAPLSEGVPGSGIVNAETLPLDECGDLIDAETQFGEDRG
ncbi:hypothetical protein [Natronococcus sp.]|uniref:hypothetical protein n=1 Tax=Natronococcus sp. TaxID=35747 RepID=UPI0025E7B120|nr:hypothetical protein [Natronococcus sp.]